MPPESSRYGQPQTSKVPISPERPRRIACSRCRGQKLRCERVAAEVPTTNVNNIGPCKRCRKAGAQCDLGFLAFQRPSRVRRALRSPEIRQSGIAIASPTQTQMPPDGERKGGWSTKHRRTLSPTVANPKPTPTHRSRGFSHGALDTSSFTGTISSSTSSSLDVPIFGEENNIPQEPVYPEPFTFDYGTNPNTSHPDTLRGTVDLLGMAVPGSRTVMPTPVPTPGDGGNREENGKLGDVEDLDAFMHIDFSSTPSQLSADPMAAHGDQTQFEQTKHKTLDEREQSVQRLLELNSSLLWDLSRISSGKLADTLAFSTPSRLKTPNNPNTNDEPLQPHNAIGRIFDSSERFLDILKYFTPPPSSTNCFPTRSSSVCSYSSDFEDGGEDLQAAGQGNRFQTDDMLDSGLRVSTDVLEDDARVPAESPRPDIPTTFAILACYTYILKIYGAIFSQIHESLLRPARLSPGAATPNTLPGLQLGGYDLDNHCDLQIEIFIHISFRILGMIHRALGLPAIACGRGYGYEGGSSRTNGILGGSSSAPLLEIVLNQKGTGYVSGNAAGVADLKETVESIRLLLRRNSIM
ncbi:MAG: hypothetical protein M1839_002321 [Geoglossum umbratile]|nr:MAG: hypothetical protein M1839_002321 [Geoglossum umbratile]